MRSLLLLCLSSSRSRQGCSSDAVLAEERFVTLTETQHCVQNHTNCPGQSALSYRENTLPPRGNGPIRTHPMTAKAGSSWRSKGKSRRKRVLKRAVMVSEEQTDHRVIEWRDGRDRERGWVGRGRGEHSVKVKV